MTDATGTTLTLAEAARRIYRTLEMSAAIMRDPGRTGGWDGAERTASAFERQAIAAKLLHDRLAALTAAPAGDGVDEGRDALRYLLNWEDTNSRLSTILKTFRVIGDRRVTTAESLENLWEALARARAAVGEREAEIRDRIINSPETADFMAGVPIEAAHQRERWAADHDAGKSPFDWFWLIGYLSQKAAAAAVAGDADKAKHHTISTAAALANWHAHLTGASTSMRPGISPPAITEGAA